MGWTVLYIAFGIVALWLLGEVLLQYKARLRWRVLAFVGFVGVVLGVLLPSIYVIVAGAVTFAVGQTFVTLSFRRGFSTGWAIGGGPGASRRRKTEGLDGHDPAFDGPDAEYDDGYNAEYAPHAPHAPQPPTGPAPDAPDAPDFAGPPEPPGAPVFAPEPMPDDTMQYGVYSDSASFPPPPDATPSVDYGQDTYAAAGYDQQGYGYDVGQQQYAAYSDPYVGTTQGYTQGYAEGYDVYGQQPGYDTGYQDPYANGYTETPPGGVWVPQQRTGDEQHGDPLGGELPPEQPYPYQSGYEAGYNEQQYRY